MGGLIAAAVVLFLIRGIFHGTAGAYVEVTVNGDVYGTYALKEDQEVLIRQNGRVTNTLTIKDGKADDRCGLPGSVVRTPEGNRQRR